MPGVFESGYLRLGLDAGFVFEKNVVIPVRIKRRIKIHEIDTGIRKIIPVLQDLQIIAVVESVHSGNRVEIYENITTLCAKVGRSLAGGRDVLRLRGRLVRR